MRSAFALAIFIVLGTASGALADSPCSPNTTQSYNSFQWNRDNFCGGSSDVDQSPWYEWWYFKVIQPDTGHAFYFTYSVVNPWDTTHAMGGTRAMVSFGDFDQHRMVNRYFPLSEFSASYLEPAVQIGENTASDKLLTGHLDDGANGPVQWALSITPDWGWNAMGWTMFVREISNIYWYPAQASAFISGWIEDLGQRYVFDRAPAYQDRNWGSSFPKWWAWLVSSEFDGSPGTVLAAGGGEPKLFQTIGVDNSMSIGLRYGGKVHEFRIVDGDPMSVNIHFGVWEVTAMNAQGEKIVISAQASRQKFMVLKFNDPDGTTFYDNEALTGEIHVALYQMESLIPLQWKQVANLTTHHGGIEYGSFDSSALSTLFNSSVELK